MISMNRSLNDLAFHHFCKKQYTEWQGDKFKLYVGFRDLQEFINILGYDYLDDTLDVYLTPDWVVFDLTAICKNFEINPEDIEKKQS